MRCTTKHNAALHWVATHLSTSTALVALRCKALSSLRSSRGRGLDRRISLRCLAMCWRRRGQVWRNENEWLHALLNEETQCNLKMQFRALGKQAMPSRQEREPSPGLVQFGRSAWTVGCVVGVSVADCWWVLCALCCALSLGGGLVASSGLWLRGCRLSWTCMFVPPGPPPSSLSLCAPLRCSSTHVRGAARQ